MRCQGCNGKICDGDMLVQVIATVVTDVECGVFDWTESSENRTLHIGCYHQLLGGEMPEQVVTEPPEPQDDKLEYDAVEQTEEVKDALHSNSSVERNNILSFLD